MHKDVVILGAGIAGLWCALELSRLGIDSALVERAPFAGGHVAGFSCKATYRCQRCWACVLEDVLEQVGSSDRITTFLRASLLEARTQNGGFTLSLQQRPPRIHYDRCTDCGLCMEACPATGALIRAPQDGRIVLDEQKCLFYRDGSCKSCLEACPEDALKLDGESTELELEANAVVPATGYVPFDPNEKPRFGYGRVPGVVTALELDSMLRNDNWTTGNGDIRSVGFIQCVGSRDVRIGRNYCSRVCCGYALRLAGLLKHRFPVVEPSMFYMDIQTFDRDFEARLERAGQEVRLIRSVPSEIRSGNDGRPQIIYHGSEDKLVMESYDLVVLSIGISPEQGPAEFLKTGINREGFLGKDGETVRTESSGVFVAGTAQGPRSISDTVSHATKTAARVASHVRRPGSGEDQ
jgi:heterodisulfide reductase subunit A2